jgi:heat induced stress protein YflT
MSTTPAPAGPGAEPPAGGGGFGTGGLNPGGLGGGGGANLPPGPGGPIAPPSAAAGTEAGAAPRSTVTIATYQNYADAQRLVDYLSDNQFPVQHASIVGTDLRLVETVIGRLTTGRAAVAGLASGAWFGLFIGLLLGIFTNSNWLGVIIVTLLIGAAWGAIFGAIAHAATGGRRDFTSRSQLQASQYAVIVDAEHADAARHMVVQMNWRAAGNQ